MEPSYNAPQASPERAPSLPPVMPEYQPGMAPTQPEREPARYEQEPQTMAPPQQLPPVQVVALPTPPVPAIPVVPTTPVVDTTMPDVAADDDQIEKEWVDKVKQVIAATTDDPHRREEEVKRIQKEYLRKRYGKELL